METETDNNIVIKTRKKKLNNNINKKKNKRNEEILNSYRHDADNSWHDGTD